jgi:hypothetical protein
MEENIRMLLEQVPEKLPRSKLEPHVDVIVTLRRKRRSYREIAEFFREHLAIAVAPSTIHDFVRIRRRRGKLSTISSGEPPACERGALELVSDSSLPPHKANP